VVDEAQDVSPLEIELLKMYSSNGWFTLLGDIKQKLLPYRGIRNWRQVSSLFDREKVGRYDSRISYRATNEITRFCNRILRGIPGSTATPLPYSRHGDKPTFKRFRTWREQLDSIFETVQEFGRLGNKSIGVVTKWNREAKLVLEYLRRRGLHNVGLLHLNGVLEAGVTVSPILLTKGLEFDAVTVVSVHDNNFAGTEFDNRLLYLACTRAKHQLSIQWFGRPSPLLPDYVQRTSVS